MNRSHRACQLPERLSYNQRHRHSPKHGHGHGQAGFTLFEILVATVVLVLIAGGGYATVSQGLRAQTAIEQRLDELSKLQRALLLLRTDLSSVRNRPIRDRYGSSLPAVLSNRNSDYLLEFTRGGVRRPAAMQGEFSNLQRIAYRFEDGRLWRHRWTVLDQAQDSESLSTPLMSGIESAEVKFFNAKLTEVKDWPEQNRDDQRPDHLKPPPAGMELILKTEQWGEIRKLFIIDSGAQQASSQQTTE